MKQKRKAREEKMQVLLIEDEDAISEEIREGLEEERYGVDIAVDGQIGLNMATQQEYSMILLDLMLPKLDGWQVCEQLRAHRILTPILMLTARDDLNDRVRGLDAGADDYLPKPFAFPELLARMRALLRRDKIHRTRIIHIADLTIDTGSRRVFRGEEEIHLTEREYTLLAALAAYEGKSLTREFIQERVWQDGSSYASTVDAWIYLLRKKVDAGRAQKLIQTVHGVGYALRTASGED